MAEKEGVTSRPGNDRDANPAASAPSPRRLARRGRVARGGGRGLAAGPVLAARSVLAPHPQDLGELLRRQDRADERVGGAEVLAPAARKLLGGPEHLLFDPAAGVVVA